MSKVAAKTYKLEGKVTQISEPREVKSKFGDRMVSDLTLQMKSGTKVRVSFWNADITEYEGATIAISKCLYKDVYKGVGQYSTTKATEVQVLKAGTGKKEEVAGEPEGEPDDGDTDADTAPTAGEPEGDEAPEETVEEAPKATKTKTTKTTTKTATKTAGFTVEAAAITKVEALAKAAFDIAGRVAPEVISNDPRAFQALAVGLLINLEKEQYHQTK